MGCWAVIDRLIDRIWQVQCRTVIESEIEREQGCIALWNDWFRSVMILIAV